MMEPCLQLKHFHKTVDNFQLGPIDLSIELGTITALIGNNSAGKSTLLKLIMNLVKRDQGEMFLFNNHISHQDESWKKNIAYMPQSLFGCDIFTGNDLKALVSPLYKSWDENLFTKIITLLDIPLTKRIGKLSQGVQQKLSFAITLACNPDILILDEPTAHIDIPSKLVMTNLLSEWMEPGDKAILIASHQIDDIRKLADYLVVLHEGKLIGKFEKEELIEQYKRYWVTQPLPDEYIPGELERGERTLISNCALDTEAFFVKEQIEWTNTTSLDLEEIITLLLTTTHGGHNDAT